MSEVAALLVGWLTGSVTLGSFWVIEILQRRRHP